MEQFDCNLPFILYRLPGETTSHLATDITVGDNCLSAEGINVITWLGQAIARMDVDTQSTSKQQYSEIVGEASAMAGKRGGKTVIVREICGEFHNFNPIKMAEEYFANFPTMFCFLFYHPSTGYWMGASPELLVTIDGKEGMTRALAGTRPATTTGDWDDKNKAEHQMVIDDIAQNIATLGTDWACRPLERQTLRYKDIEHLCTPIALRYSGEGDMPIRRVISALHPTAAVGGYPREMAIADIGRLEKHSRKFYAGVISTDTTAYVVLRCVHFDKRHWCVYTGSGITGLSQADDEWAETQAKAAPLLSLLNKY